jgi:uncharacterized membrane-anchored protein YhcB (DUF1043 family)
MRTIIALAVGIYLGRQLSKNFDQNKSKVSVRSQLTGLLEKLGVDKDQIEKHLDELIKMKKV